MSTTVSVIIPVYNAEKYIDRCLNCVCSQSYRDLEIILVNDGSTDTSHAICVKHAKNDARIKIIDKKNGGPGDARNAALAVASGEYIQFVDADDILLHDATEKLVHAMDTNDMVIAHYNLCIQNNKVDKGLIKEDAAMEREAFLAALVRYPGSFFYSALWNKLYSRALIEKYNLRFHQRLAWGEDFEFNMKYYDKLQRVRFIPNVVYNYFWTTSGQTWRTLFKLPRNIRIKKHLYQTFRQIYIDEGIYRKNKFLVDRYIFNVTLFD